MSERKPAELFPPGDYIKEELEARGWTQADLAEIMGRSPNDIVNLVSGKRSISPEIAKELAAALGTSPDMWINLESSYRLWVADAPPDAIKRRAFLHGLAPYKEMGRRRWLELSENIVVLEQRIMDYFEMARIDAPIVQPFASRKSTPDVSPAQLAWVFRAKHLARTVPAGPYSARSFERAIPSLKSLLLSAPEARHVPRILSEAGIRFLVVEQLTKAKIDGATLWLDAKSPVVALSLRYDRMDYFWYTLCHELGHVVHGDGGHLDEGIFGEDRSSDEDIAEREANQFAADFLINQAALDDFIARNGPLYRGDKIRNFARLRGIHPVLVIGQLQHRGEVPWSHFHAMLDKVRPFVTQSALTDGWGQVLPILN